MHSREGWCCVLVGRQASDLEDGRLRAVRHAVASDPNNVKALLELGDLQLKLNEHHKALSAYERVAQLYYRAGALVKAVAVYKQMHQLIARYAPQLADRYRHTEAQLAEILERLGLIDDALAQHRSHVRRNMAEGDDLSAIGALENVVRMAPHDDHARLMLASLLARRDKEAAIVVLEQAVTMSLSAGRRASALAALETLGQLRSRPQDARLAAELLLERASAGDAQLALAKLQICYRDNPRDLRTLHLLVCAFDDVGMPRKGDEVLKEAARIARESGAQHIFGRILNALLTRAPDDPSVIALLRAECARV
jgi:tetratricopeptide (TPR) repeat protein